MAQSTCSVEGCERLHFAKTYCRKHYDLLKRRGSVDASPRRIPGNICSLEGCEYPASARGYCAMHYQRFMRGDAGDLELKGWRKGYERGEVRPCWWCQTEFEIADGRKLYCTSEHAALVKSLWNVGKYGITRDDYRDAWYRQGGVCAVCRQPERTVRNRLLAVDHDHETGEFRGLLCSHCNRGIGLFGDDLERLLAAAEYIERHRAVIKGETHD